MIRDMKGYLEIRCATQTFFRDTFLMPTFFWSTEKWKTLVFLLICDASITPTHQPKHGRPKFMQKNSSPQKDRKVISYQIVINHFFYLF